MKYWLISNNNSAQHSEIEVEVLLTELEPRKVSEG
jgi:hypothetical protein